MTRRMISPNFSWEEATFTTMRDPETGRVLENDPGPLEAKALEYTFDRMERVRFICGDRSIVVHSAYRSPLVNRRVGGSPISQHMKGESVDFHVIGLSIFETFGRIRASMIGYDQLIEEARTWIHISFVQDRKPREQALRMRVVDGRMKYEPVP